MKNISEQKEQLELQIDTIQNELSSLPERVAKETDDRPTLELTLEGKRF